MVAGNSAPQNTGKSNPQERAVVGVETRFVISFPEARHPRLMMNVHEIDHQHAPPKLLAPERLMATFRSPRPIGDAQSMPVGEIDG